MKWILKYLFQKKYRCICHSNEIYTGITRFNFYICSKHPVMEKNDTKLREHLANERTFLAWIRTAVALIGLGFIIVKFAVFLKEVSIIFQDQAVPQTEGFSSAIGIVIVAFGVGISPFAFYQYKKVEKQINKQSYRSSSMLSALLTMAIIAGGILLIINLLTNLNF